MNNKLTKILVHLIFTTSFYVNAQENISLLKQFDDNQSNFYHLKLAEGMAQNSITSMNQDTVGQMWFATKEGVVRYDAKQFHYYRHDPQNPRTIGGNFVERVYVAHDGSVWLGTQPAVLSKYHPETDDFFNIEGIKGNRIKDISQDKQHIYWITSDRYLHKYDNQDMKLTTYSYLNANVGIDRLLITKSGRMFITTNKTYILEFNPKTEKFAKVELLRPEEMAKPRTTESYSLYHLTEDKKNNIWITTPFGFLIKYNPVTGNKQRYIFKLKKNIHKDKIEKLLTVMFIFEDNQQSLWFGTWFDGLYKILPNRKEFVHFLPDENNPNRLSNSIVHSGFQDNAGNYWFGTEFAGINILKKANKFSIIAHDKNNLHSLPAIKFSFVVKDKNGRKWIGSMGGGLYYSDKNTSNYYKNKDLSLHIWAPTALVDNNKNLWFGVEKNLIKYNPNTKDTIIFRHRSDDYNSLSRGNITTIYQDKNSIFWIGTSGGLTRFDEANNKFIRFLHDNDNSQSLSNNYITSITSDKNNNIWVGTLKGLNKLNKASGNFTIFKQDSSSKNSISDNRINDLVAVKNNIWIATDKGGLVQYDLTTKQFSIYNKNNGLSDNSIRGIERDKYDNLWMTTKHNIVKFDAKTKQFINYDASDGLYKKIYIEHVGLQNIEFEPGFSNKDNEGYLYFGGTSGITIFHPDSLLINKCKPSTIIEYFGVNGVNKQVRRNHDILLKNKENNLKFVLATLNFTQPDKNQYAYRLKGFDTSWHFASHNSVAEYTHVPYGKYIFQYKGANNDGIWGAVYQTPAIIIAPPYFKTIGFYSLVLFFVFVIIFGFIVYRYYLYKKIENQKKKLRYQSSNLKDEDAQRIDNKFKKYIIEDKLFLEPDISLQKLAKIINERPHYVSQVINQLYQKRFHDFINSYRILEAKNLLTTTYLKIEAIAYDAGFNSLSTFNTVFKKEVGVTPSKYRKSNQK